MRRTTTAIATLVTLAALAIAATQLLPLGSSATRSFDHVANELCIVAPATPYPPESGLDMLAPRAVPAEARCPVCGMYPARTPRWAGQVIFTDGAAHYFDSPVDLFSFLQRVDRHDRNYTADDVAMTFVTDFESGEWIETERAFFVHGSTLLGPMRDADLPAFSSRSAADALVAKRGGTVLTSREVTSELIQSLSQNLHHRH